MNSYQKQFDRLVQSAKRRFWRQQDDLLHTHNNNKKEFWKYIGQLGIARDRNIDQLVDSEGNVISNPEQMMEMWSSHFRSLLNPVNEGTEEKPTPNLPHIDPHHNALHQVVINRDISREEVNGALIKAKMGKAIGCDLIPMEILKNGDMVDVLLNLFNVCFKSGDIPTEWKKSLVIPVFKSGDQRHTRNYRGISITSSIYKIYCMVLNTRLETWAEELGIFHDEQNGFRKARSCSDHLSSLVSIIETRKLQKRSTFCAFIDFSSAYDRISRDLLWVKLKSYGLTGRMYLALQGIYHSVWSAVKVNGDIGPWFQVHSGLKQGCLNSTFFFNIFLNDLIGDIKSLGKGVRIGEETVSILCYADDLVLISEKEGDLQAMLNELHEWCEKWGMVVNGKKTKIVHFRPKQRSRTAYKFVCGTQHIEMTDSYKYLGLVLDENLNFDITVKAVAQSAHRALGLLIAKDRAHGGMPFHIFSSLYDTLVQPIISYGASVWGQKSYGRINAVQNRAMKYFMGLPKCAPTAAAYGDTGWLDPETRQWMVVGQQWCRLINMDEGRVNKKIFLWSCRAANSGVKNWAYRNTSKWRSMNMSCSINEPLHMRSFKNDIKTAQYEQFCNKWKQTVESDTGTTKNGKNKLRLYNKFKLDTKPEGYLKLSYKYRSIIAKFRSGVAPINIELGRYAGIAERDRMCSKCNITEDENHVLLKCPLYDGIREKLFEHISMDITNFNTLTDEEKMGLLLANGQYCKSSARACLRIMEERSLYMNS